ncbi:hypothetical protein MCOR25_000005 [Pyricularia grisea]|uniref:Uncharacterized protein n=1 Tax=Pyricularia grisea TaxID=148305 RepID=A0A6P8B8J2_PYRGI|nr:uncharacterized protein PgNI_03540 [Pyricularia grisea]KAI6383548.1 hypothetical protein MCOR25_000005 [Pyricularia grisea]TLD12174.1 hypothetical protein PgNI_03540 [Pyricularia grisea]
MSQRNPFNRGGNQKPASVQDQPCGNSSQQQRPQDNLSDLARGMSGLGVTTTQTMDDAIFGIKEELSGIRAQLQSDERMQMQTKKAKGICRNAARKEVQDQNAHVMQSIEEMRSRIDGLTNMVSGWINTTQANISSPSQEGDGGSNQ